MRVPPRGNCRQSLKRRDFLAAGVSAGALAAMGFAPARAGIATTLPNIVVIVVDDMRFDEYGAGGHPFLETPHIDALGRSGATFINAYHTTPLCSPNRACILTGQYASRHGILDNTARSLASHQLRTFARELQPAGYETAHIGKWHMGNDPTPRPGYDYWVSFAGQGRSRDPEIYEDGRLHRVTGYLTDLLTDRAIEFATRARTRPFMLYVGHKAIHPDIQQRDDGSVDTSGGQRFIPADRHRGRYSGKSFPRRANYGLTAALRANQPVIADALDVKRSAQTLRAFGADVLDDLTSDATIQSRAQMMLAVDEGLGRLMSALEEKSLHENTLVVFMSDNGYFFGEHGLSVERRLPYEESIKCPLLIAHPARIEPGRRIEEFALSIDIAPTTVAAAGAPVPRRMQGASLLALLAGRRPPWRDSFLIEYYGHENPFPWIVSLDYRAARFGKHKYIRWLRHDDAEELYDLEQDPFELRNLAREATAASILVRARDIMASAVVQSLGMEP